VTVIVVNKQVCCLNSSVIIY